MSNPKLVTQDYLKELFDYSKGNLFWRRGINSGKAVGCLRRDGYLGITINNKNYLIHRLIWMFHYGKLPKYLDHKNGIKNDNRIENLRSSTQSQNLANSKRPINNTSGYKGVYWSKCSRKWQAQIVFKNKNNYLGVFDDIKSAAEAYEKASKHYFGEFSNVKR